MRFKMKNVVRLGALVLAALLASTAAQAQGPQQEPQQTQAQPRLTAEQLVAHPGLASGETESMRAYLLAALEAEPESPLALEAVLRMSQLRSDGEAQLADDDGIARLLALAERVADAEASFWLRWIVHGEAAMRRYSDRPVRLEGDLFQDLLRGWRVIGGLGSLDGVPAATAGPPNSSPEPGSLVESIEEAYVGEDGVRREWKRLTRQRNAIFIDPSLTIHPERGLGYALTFVRSAELEGKEALLEIRCSGAFRAYWNGVLAIDEPRLDPFDTESRSLARVRIQPGWNAVLLRVDCAADSLVAARVLDSVGRGLALEEALEDQPILLPWSRDEAAHAQGIERLAAPLLTKPAEASPFGAALQVLRATLANRPDIALSIPAPAGDVQPSPERTAWLHHRFRALQSAAYLPEEIMRRQLLDMIGMFKLEGPFFPEARHQEISMFLNEDRPFDALVAADQWVEDAPGRPWPRFTRTFALDAIDSLGTLSRLATEDFLRDFPTHGQARRSLSEILGLEDDQVGAVAIAWDLVQDDGYNEAAYESVLEALVGTSDPRLALLLERAQVWSDDHPGDIAAEVVVERLLAINGETQKLLELAAADAEKRPWDPNVWWALAGRRLQAGDTAGARAAYEEELALNPADRTTRHLLSRLGKADPAEEFFAEFAPDREAALAAAASVEDASVIEALDSGLVYVFPDGSSHARNQTLTIPRDRKGTEALLRKPDPGGTLVIQVLTEDGRTLEPVMTEGEWVMPSLEVGDVVETVWDTASDPSGGTLPALNSWRFASFERAFPTSRWVVYIPDSLRRGRIEARNFEGDYSTVKWGEGTVHIYEASSPREIPELDQPSYEEILPLATMFADRDRVGDVGLWRDYLQRLQAIPLDVEPQITAFIAEHGRDADPLERAKRLYTALESRTQSYEGQQSAVSVWLMQRGQPLGLLAAIYERAGIPFDWAVFERPVSPEMDPEPITLFENIRPLGRPLLRVGGGAGDEEATWIVLGSAPGTPFGALDEELAGAPLWVISQEGEARKGALPRKFMEDVWNADVELTYRLDGDGNAEVTGAYVDTRPSAEVLLRQIREATAEQRDGFALQQSANLAPGVDLREAGVVLDGSAGPGVVIQFSGSLPRFAQARGGKHVVSVPFLPLQLTERFGVAERSWPLALRASYRLRVRITVELGDLWSIESGPKAVSEEREGLSVVLGVDQSEPGKVIFEERFVQRGAFVEPGDMPAFLTKMAELDAEFGRALRLQRGE